MKTNSQEKLRYTLFDPTASKFTPNIEVDRIDLVALHSDMGVVQKIKHSIQVYHMRLSEMSDSDRQHIRAVLNAWKDELNTLVRQTSDEHDSRLLHVSINMIIILLTAVNSKEQESASRDILLVRKAPDENIQAIGIFQKGFAQEAYYHLQHLITAPHNLKLNTIDDHCVFQEMPLLSSRIY